MAKGYIPKMESEYVLKYNRCMFLAQYSSQCVYRAETRKLSMFTAPHNTSLYVRRCTSGQNSGFQRIFVVVVVVGYKNFNILIYVHK